MGKKKQYVKETESVEEVTNDIVSELPGSDVEVSNDIVEDIATEEIEEEQKEVKGTVNCPKLNLREQPNINSKVITVLNANTIVIINEEVNDFYNITVYISDAIFNGYCMSKFIDTVNE